MTVASFLPAIMGIYRPEKIIKGLVREEGHISSVGSIIRAYYYSLIIASNVLCSLFSFQVRTRVFHSANFKYRGGR